jgi:hypothetical protein
VLEKRHADPRASFPERPFSNVSWSIRYVDDMVRRSIPTVVRTPGEGARARTAPPLAPGREPPRPRGGPAAARWPRPHARRDPRRPPVGISPATRGKAVPAREGAIKLSTSQRLNFVAMDQRICKVVLNALTSSVLGATRVPDSHRQHSVGGRLDHWRATVLSLLSLHVSGAGRFPR